MKPFFRKIVNYVDANHGFPASTVAQWSPFRPHIHKEGFESPTCNDKSEVQV